MLIMTHDRIEVESLVPLFFAAIKASALRLSWVLKPDLRSTFWGWESHSSFKVQIDRDHCVQRSHINLLQKPISSRKKTHGQKIKLTETSKFLSLPLPNTQSVSHAALTTQEHTCAALKLILPLPPSSVPISPATARAQTRKVRESYLVGRGS